MDFWTSPISKRESASATPGHPLEPPLDSVVGPHILLPLGQHFGIAAVAVVMKSPAWGASRPVWLALLWACGVCVRADFVEPPPSYSMRSLAESETRLPCHYQVEGEEQVVQVTWYREQPDGTKEQIITAHTTDGHTEFGRFSGRVRFEYSSPTANSALLLLTTEESDEGLYTCRITTFPSGNFEREVSLTVWTSPISSLEPAVLTEGQSFRVAASCRAVGRPPPRLSWDTDLPGQSSNRSSEGGVVSSHFSLHPLRSLNGRRLDCLVWHATLDRPRRIANRLVVHYPPEATFAGYDGNWFVGREGAQLTCESGGIPKPRNFTWTRRGGALPEGVSVMGDKLLFGRALTMNDSGVYECVAQNSAGAGKAEFTLTVAAAEKSVQETAFDKLLIVIVGVAAGVLVLIMILIILLVNRYHRRKNKKLAMELSERTEEMNTLSRQTSLRRLNSVSSDPRAQTDVTSLRVDSRMKHSLLSLEDRPIYRGSQSTLGGRGGGGEAEVDYLGRPVLYVESGWRDGGRSPADVDREREERRRRVESYLKSSNMSLDSGLPSSLVPTKPQQDGSGSASPRDPDLPPLPRGERGGGGGGGVDQEDWSPRLSHVLPEADEADCSYQISEALTNHFHYSNGFLRPKPHSNAIILHPRGQII